MKNEANEFIKYHYDSMAIRDIDPQNDCLKYVCDRFELNIEQRYWLAFLFACSYSPTTVYYIYNEFPDYENVDVGRLSRWWSQNKDKTIFQTDRLRIKTQNKLVETFESYRSLLSGKSQHMFFRKLCISNAQKNYDSVWDETLKIKNFGRFTNFIYLELLHEICGLNITPSKLDVKNADSCKDGLCMAYGIDHLIGEKINNKEALYLENLFDKTVKHLQKNNPYKDMKITAWGVETTLCAFKKHKRESRWVGYYIDRQLKEIMKMQENVKDGVDWSVLYQFREETYDKRALMEKTGSFSDLKEAYVF